MNFGQKINFIDEILSENKKQQDIIKTLILYGNLDDYSKLKLMGLSNNLRECEKGIKKIRNDVLDNH